MLSFAGGRRPRTALECEPPAEPTSAVRRSMIIGCMTASTILEPIAEGLALFAEFDTYPGNSAWMSQTLTTSLIFFAAAVESLLGADRCFSSRAFCKRFAGIRCFSSAKQVSTLPP